VWTAIVRPASADSFIAEAQDEGADYGGWKRLIPACYGSGRYARPARVRNASLRGRQLPDQPWRVTVVGFRQASDRKVATTSLAARSDSPGGGTTLVSLSAASWEHPDSLLSY
jgi:hypothetical protein